MILVVVMIMIGNFFIVTYCLIYSLD